MFVCDRRPPGNIWTCPEVRGGHMSPQPRSPQKKKAAPQWQRGVVTGNVNHVTRRVTSRPSLVCYSRSDTKAPLRFTVTPCSHPTPPTVRGGRTAPPATCSAVGGPTIQLEGRWRGAGSLVTKINVSSGIKIDDHLFLSSRRRPHVHCLRATVRLAAPRGALHLWNLGLGLRYGCFTACLAALILTENNHLSP